MNFDSISRLIFPRRCDNPSKRSFYLFLPLEMCACAVSQLLAGKQPWAGLDKHEVMRLVLEGRRPPKVPEMLSQRGNHLVKHYEACLSAESDKRPNMQRVVDILSPSYSSSPTLNW